MIQQLLKDCFRQAKRETEVSSKTGLCKYLADRVTEDYGYSVSYKTLERLYNGYILETVPQPEIKNQLLQKLAKYRGFQDYADYTSRNLERSSKTSGATPRLNITAYVLIGIIFLALVGYPLYKEYSKPNCMTWVDDHYEKKNAVAMAQKDLTNSVSGK
jgi:hypothetical protein